MSAQDYTVDASAVGCCRGAHVWDSPDGFVPEDGRQVTCRVCPATARAKPEGQVDRLVGQVSNGAGVVSGMVLRAAMEQAQRATPLDSRPQGSDALVLEVFWAAIRTLRQAPDAKPPEPDCVCGHPEDTHVWSDWANARPCDERDNGCGCLDYTPRREPECNGGNHGCGGCYPSAHGGSEP